ncbi:hypothetical protein DID74_01770 [Candidatus Marinamargulisbacteria bacterium SCGC AG-333-B06]|nr:hypothetical protein DID74_01770 [Candidatus Marinamargulisbacteria bacterium SCGC AG-333-B06]
MKHILWLLVGLISLNGAVFAENPPYYEQHYASKEEALKASFPKAIQFEENLVSLNSLQIDDLNKRLGWKIKESEFNIIKAVSAKNTCLGYAMILHEKGKYHPITFLVAVTPTFSINRIVVMIYREKIGKDVRKKRFLRQYKGKTKEDPLIVDYDIMGISGATISSWTITAGAKKAMIIIEAVLASSMIKS